MYQYSVTNPRVIDGDSIEVDIDLGFDVILRRQVVRLAKLDTAEVRTKDKKEKAVGEYTQAFVILLMAHDDLMLNSISFNRGKYGRIIGDIWIPALATSWSESLLKHNLAIPEHLAQDLKTDLWHGMHARLIEEDRL